MRKRKPNFNNIGSDKNLDVKPIHSQKKKKKKQRKKPLEISNGINEATATPSQLLTNGTSSEKSYISTISAPSNVTQNTHIPSQQEKKKLKKLRQKEKKLAAKEIAASNGKCTAETDSIMCSNGAVSFEVVASVSKNLGAIPKDKSKLLAVIPKVASAVPLSKKQQKKLQKQIKLVENNVAKMPINTKEQINCDNTKNLQNSKPKSKKKKKKKKKEQDRLEIKKISPFQRQPPQPKTFAMHKPPRKSTLLKPLVFDVTPGETFTWAREFQQLVRSELACNAQTTPFYEIGRHFGMHSTRTDDVDIKQLFEKFLVEKKAGHFTYTPKQELRVLLVLKKPQSLVVCSAIDVKNALQHLGVPFLRIEDFKSMWKPDHSYGRFLIEVSREIDLQVLYKQTKLLGHENWKWSKLKKPAISQCRNCQRYGHVAKNCHMPFRCVKCVDPHEPGKCPRSWIKDGIKNVYCHNCKKSGHPSNYRGCPAYKQRCEALERQRANCHFSALIKKVVHSVNKALHY